MKWISIEELPEEYKNNRKMFVVIGINVELSSGYKYTSDPVCVWVDMIGEFIRWPHKAFKPTHFCELPKQ